MIAKQSIDQPYTKQTQYVSQKLFIKQENIL